MLLGRETDTGREMGAGKMKELDRQKSSLSFYFYYPSFKYIEGCLRNLDQLFLTMIEQWACSNKLAYLRKERRRQEGRRRCILQWQFGGFVVAVRRSRFAVHQLAGRSVVVGGRCHNPNLF